MVIAKSNVLELDRKAGEIDIYVNNRLMVRGEVVLAEKKFDVTC